jgi:putative transposase
MVSILEGDERMPTRASQMILSEKEQEELAQIIRRHRSEQHVVLRARIVLAAAHGHSNAQIARELNVHVETVRLWRDRWVGLQGIDLETVRVAERVHDAPRPGAKPRFSEEQRCQIAALACEMPQQSERPISQWAGREIADDVKVRGIVTQISPRHAARWLKKGASNRTAFGTG